MSDAHLRQVLAKYPLRLGAVNTAEQVRSQIAYDFQNVQSVSFSGSSAKGTAIHIPNRGSDMDLFISTRTGSTLKDLYNYTYEYARIKGWNPKRQNVSIGTQIGGYDIDLVPGRVQDGYSNWHSLYVRREDSWLQTNVKLHIDTVSQSGRLEEIRLYKLWRNLHELDFTDMLQFRFRGEEVRPGQR